MKLINNNANQEFLSFLSRIEGYKTRLKELHWAADSMSRHDLIDKFSDELSKYQDDIAEDYQAVNDFFVGCLNPTLPNSANFMDLLSEITTDVESSGMPEGIAFIGIKSLTESFIHTLRKYHYLARRSYHIPLV